ncbi:radical SAM protein [Myxococcota bacterium]|nr:radical SAM protein [Myxococcota bacterium]
MSAPRRRLALLVYVGDPSGTDYPLALWSLRGAAAADPHVSAAWDVAVRVFPHGASPGAVARAVAGASPDLVGLSTYVWNAATILAAGAAAARLLPGVPIVAGGPEAYPEAEERLARSPWLAGVCLGEGEVAFVELLRARAGGGGWPARGWARRGEDGRVGRDPEPAPVPMDDLPVLLRPGNEEMARPGGPVLYETSRGCPFACRFCYWSGEQLGARVRRRAADVVEAELDFALSRAPRELFLVDAELNSTVEHATRVLEAVVRARERHPASARTVVGLHLLLGVGRVDAGLARLARRAGARVIVGIQSLNPRALKRMGRGWSRIDVFHEELALLREAGNAIYNFDLIYGLPGDSLAHFREGARWVLDRGHRLWVGPLLVLPGTRFRSEAEEHGLAYAPEPPYEVLRSEGWSPAEIDRARRLGIGIDLYNRVGEALPIAAAALGTDLLDLLEAYGEAVDDGGDGPGGRGAPSASVRLAEFLAARAGEDGGLAAWTGELLDHWEHLRRADPRPFGASGPRSEEVPGEAPPLAPEARLRVGAPVLFRTYRFPIASFHRGWEGPRRPGRASVVLFSPSLPGGAMEVPPGTPAALRALDGGATAAEAGGAMPPGSKVLEVLVARGVLRPA